MRFLLMALLLLLIPASAVACSCGAPGPACSYISDSKVIFLGTPVFTDDDGSGTFVQRTLYKFQVKEAFKGLAADTKEVWVDPGSFTSCYAVYRIGKDYLVFAGEAWGGMGSSPAMTVAAPGKKAKPLPAGFTPDTPVYYAPECNGTRWADSANDEIGWLRLWRDGKTSTRAYGTVTAFDLPVSGAIVEITSEHGVQKTTSSEKGEWSFENITPGHYTVTAALPDYTLDWKREAVIPAGACGYFDNLWLSTESAITGKIVDAKGKPVPDIHVQMAKMMPDGNATVLEGFVPAEKDGSFRFEGAAGDFVVGINLDTPPNSDVPYPPTYAPGVSDLKQARIIHIAPKQQVTNVELRLSPPLPIRRVDVKVTLPDGRPAPRRTWVEAHTSEHGGREIGEVEHNGVAHLKCLAGQSYQISARTTPAWKSDIPLRSQHIQVSSKVDLPAGVTPATIKLVLDKTKKAIEED